MGKDCLSSATKSHPRGFGDSGSNLRSWRYADLAINRWN